MGSYFSSHKECSGAGECLIEINRNHYRADPKFFCPYECMPQECPNYIVCETLQPTHILNKSSNKICRFCDLKFGSNLSNHGILPQKIIDECGICYCENVAAISNPNCTHFICIDCFKKCYAAILPTYANSEPRFPYGRHLYMQYAQDPDAPDWHEFPEIVAWSHTWSRWEERRNTAISKLARCPFCRK